MQAQFYVIGFLCPKINLKNWEYNSYYILNRNLKWYHSCCNPRIKFVPEVMKLDHNPIHGSRHHICPTSMAHNAMGMNHCCPRLDMVSQLGDRANSLASSPWFYQSLSNWNSFSAHCMGVSPSLIDHQFYINNSDIRVKGI